MTQIRIEMIESSSLKGKGKTQKPPSRALVISGFYIWQEVGYLCLHQPRPRGEHSAQNPQEEFGQTYQSSLVFKNPPSQKGNNTLRTN